MKIQEEQKDFWLELSDAHKSEVELGLKQVADGETEDWDDFLKGISCTSNKTKHEMLPSSAKQIANSAAIRLFP
jgi:hypothetical protein